MGVCLATLVQSRELKLAGEAVHLRNSKTTTTGIPELVRYRHVKRFLEETAASIERLDVNYVSGATPTLVLQAGEDSFEVVPIENLTYADIVEYLAQSLEPA